MRITPEQALKQLRTGAVLVDVRTCEEYKAGHIPDAKNLPLDELGDAAWLLPDQTASVIVYCASGARSARAAAMLAAAGYTHVFDLGAITAWPYEVCR